MTKKDYEIIANTIATLLSDNQGAPKGLIEGITATAETLAVSLEVTNPRFSREKFLTACGIECEHSFSSFDGKCHNCGKHISED